MTFLRFLAIGVPTLIVGACVSTPVPEPQTAPAAAAVSAPAQSGASALSYGTVTSQVIKGKTTQMDLIQLLGGPNISTVDNEGVETWIYERSVTQTDVSSRNQSWQAAANLGAFFGQLSAGAQAGVARDSASSSTVTSFRSLTVWVKFTDDKRVKDYSVRASQF